MTGADRRRVRRAAWLLSFRFGIVALAVAAMAFVSYWFNRASAVGLIPDRGKTSNPMMRGVPDYVFYEGRAQIVRAAARRQHAAALVARFRRETGRWPRDQSDLIRRYGDRQTVTARDADHPALDYRLSEVPVALLGERRGGARMSIRVSGFDTVESVVPADTVYPPAPTAR